MNIYIGDGDKWGAVANSPFRLLSLYDNGELLKGLLGAIPVKVKVSRMYVYLCRIYA